MACADIGFVGARGSGQAQNDSGGFGAEIYAAYQQVRTRTHFSVAALPVVYPADSVDDFLPTLAELRMLTSGNLHQVLLAVTDYIDGVEKYFSSIAQGVTATNAILQTYRRQCPDMRFILAGYSQGAMVMHTEMLNLVAARADGTIYTILAGLLVGDGDRVPNTRANLVGTAPAGDEGVRPYFDLTDADVPSVFARRTYEVCNAGDIICDTRLAEDIEAADQTALPPLTLFLELYAAVLVHTQSYLTSPALPQATNAIVRGLINTPLSCRSGRLAPTGSRASIANGSARDTGCTTAAGLVRAVDDRGSPAAGRSLNLRVGAFSCTSPPARARGGSVLTSVTCRSGRAEVRFDYAV